MPIHFILYVRDQAVSTGFYRDVLQSEPRLHVPGMTEFDVGGAHLPAPSAGQGTARAEVYFLVEDPGGHHDRALRAGARELSPLAPRGWGHEAAYSLDLDGYVLAFARER
jgi:hypothetical protein